METNIVKVRYQLQDKTESREYTYYALQRLKVNDIVVVPIKDSTGMARVTAIDVPDAEIEHFRDKVKTIPSGPFGGEVNDPKQDEGIELEIIDDVKPIRDPYYENMQEMGKRPEIILSVDLGFPQAEPVVVTEPEPYEKTKSLIIVEQKAKDTTLEVFNFQEITSPEQHEVLEKCLTNIRVELQDLEKKRQADVKTPNDYVKWINGKYREGSDLLKRAESHCLKVIGDFRRKEKVKADAEQVRLNAIAQKAFEKRQAEEAAARKKEEEAREAEEAARKAGDLEAAEKARIAALKAAAEAERKMSAIPVAVVQKVDTIAKTADTGSGKNIWGLVWDCEIMNADLVPREYCLPDEKRIREFAKLYKDKAAMPGVRFFTKDKVSVRRSTSNGE